MRVVHLHFQCLWGQIQSLLCFCVRLRHRKCWAWVFMKKFTVHVRGAGRTTVPRAQHKGRCVSRSFVCQQVKSFFWTICLALHTWIGIRRHVPTYHTSLRGSEWWRAKCPGAVALSPTPGQVMKLGLWLRLSDSMCITKRQTNHLPYTSKKYVFLQVFSGLPHFKSSHLALTPEFIHLPPELSLQSHPTPDPFLSLLHWHIQSFFAELPRFLHKRLRSLYRVIHANFLFYNLCARVFFCFFGSCKEQSMRALTQRWVRWTWRKSSVQDSAALCISIAEAYQFSIWFKTKLSEPTGKP